MSKFNVRGEQSQLNSFTFITGLGPAEVVAVNPTQKQLAVIMGRELPESLFNYEIRENPFSEVKERPVVFWLHNAEYDIYVPMQFNVGNVPFESANKEWKGFINRVGSYTLARSSEELDANPKMDWFTKYGYRQAFVGENSLYTFMQKMLRYNNRDKNAAWLEDMETNNCTISSIFKGDYSGLVEFVDHCKNLNSKIGVVYTVRERTMEDGSTKYYQEVLTDPKTFYWTNGEIGVKALNSFDEYVKREQAKGRDLTKSHYTVELMPFERNKTINMETVSEEAENVSALKSDDLPF